MLSNKLLLAVIPVVIFLLIPFTILPQEGDEEESITEKPELQISELMPEFNFDGYFSLTEWQTAIDSIADLTTIEPEEGGEPKSPTIIKVFADKDNVIVAVKCFDDKPNEIVSYSKARDADLSSEDYVVLVFDTFLDGRSGYVFAVNPDGARFDGLVVEQGEDVNSEWDAIWEAKTSKNEDGWYVEFKIPIKSLSYKQGLNEWGLNIQRRVQRLQETSRWSAPIRDFEIYQTNRAGVLIDLPAFDLGIGLSIRPSIVIRTGKQAGEKSKYDIEPSLDVTQRLGPNLLSSLTINTDFAETEVDVRQINLTRFPSFFPEKRTFFLQGSDIFEFGAALDEDNVMPFFSRRIGLFDEDEQIEIPINAGIKLNGRIENTNVGALVVNTRKMDNLQIGDVDEDNIVNIPQTTMGAFRVNQNIFEESTVGVLGTFGDQLGRSGAWSGGIDFVYRTSNFMDEKNFLVSVWGLFNDRNDLAGDKSALGIRIDYPNDLFDINITTIRIGDGFDPSMSFVPRKNIHIWDFGAEYKPRPSWELVREMKHEIALTLYNKRNNSSWESYDATITPIDWLFESGDQFEAGIIPEGDRPPEIFELATDLDIPAGTYEWIRYYLGFTTANKRTISGSFKWEFGDFYNGNLNTFEASLAYKPSSFFTLELTGESNTGTAFGLPDDFEPDVAEEDPLLEEVSYTEQLFGVRLQFNISAYLQISSFTQYDTQSKELGTNNGLYWTFNPFGEIFIVYNHNEIWRAEDKRWQFVSNELPIKIQYTWRF